MAKTITHHLLDVRKRHTDRIAIQFKVKGKWQRRNWQEFFELCENAGHALLSLGVDRGDRVAILANTRWEWSVSDFAILGIGAITVPIYHNNLNEDIEYIIKDSEAKVLICENAAVLAKWQTLKANCPSVHHVICMETSDKVGDEAISFYEFLNLGGEHKAKTPNVFIDHCSSNELNQTATIIYTSGTTGSPKGVVLTHRQIMSEVKEAFPLLGVNESDVSLSFLPYAHVLGRIDSWGAVFIGYTLSFAESIERIKINLQEIRPTIFIGVPRIFEKIYAGILTQLESHRLQKGLFDWALKIGQQVGKLRQQRKILPITLAGQYLVAKKLVFDPLKEKLGGRLRFAVCGGAPLSREIGEFFHAAGILLLEGYGLTETTAAITVNTPFDYQFGTVGKPIGDVKIRIAADGEILVKSDKVMKEYYKNEHATREVFVDGYFATGDIGELTSEGHLRITDRKKDLIKTAGGKYVAPQKLENLLKLNQYVSNVLVHGDQRKYIVTLITLNEAALKNFAKENGLSKASQEELARDPRVREIIRSAVADTNSQLSSFETIKNFEILPRDFTIEDGELTPSLKVKRRFCDQKYKVILDRLYGIESEAPAASASH